MEKQQTVYDYGKRMVIDRACKGCIYLGRAGCHGCCDYIFIKGKPRPCPPGKACTVKETKRKKRGTKDVKD